MKKKIQNFIRVEDGFSLIEIAIALVIIGLIIGGALKGKELIDSAKINFGSIYLKRALLMMWGWPLITNWLPDKGHPHPA